MRWYWGRYDDGDGQLLIAGLIVVLVALVARLASVTRRRRQLRGSMTEAQAREDAAPLTTAIQRRTVCERRVGDALLDASRARSAERCRRVLVAQGDATSGRRHR